eukprot:4566682-Prymnesium_polylepis.1
MVASETERMRREFDALRAIDGMQHQCSSLPSMLYSFTRSDASIFLVFKEQVVCELDTLLDPTSHAIVAETDLRFICACVVQALGILHEKLNLLYRNLEPFNISVFDNGYVALMDLRIAKNEAGDDGQGCRTTCGRPAYMPPEMVHGEAQGYGIDWWQLGVLLYHRAPEARRRLTHTHAPT